jgi:hypothetical protein
MSNLKAHYQEIVSGSAAVGQFAKSSPALERYITFRDNLEDLEDWQRASDSTLTSTISLRSWRPYLDWQTRSIKILAFKTAQGCRDIRVDLK